MAVDVYFTPRAKQDLNEASEWYANRSQEAALNWLDALEQVVNHLGTQPGRFPPSFEDQKFPIRLQQVVFGDGKRKTHRLVFTIRPDKVVVYAIRHLAQQELTLDDFA